MSYSKEYEGLVQQMKAIAPIVDAERQLNALNQLDGAASIVINDQHGNAYSAELTCIELAHLKSRFIPPLEDKIRLAVAGAVANEQVVSQTPPIATFTQGYSANQAVHSEQTTAGDESSAAEQEETKQSPAELYRAAAAAIAEDIAAATPKRRAQILLYQANLLIAATGIESAIKRGGYSTEVLKSLEILTHSGQ